MQTAAPSYVKTALHPLFGVAVAGFNLADNHSAETIAEIQRDLQTHRQATPSQHCPPFTLGDYPPFACRLVVFKGQGRVSGEAQVRISEWFGRVESTFYKHPKSPHPDVFRVSNDENEGCTNVGRSGECPCERNACANVTNVRMKHLCARHDPCGDASSAYPLDLYPLDLSCPPPSARAPFRPRLAHRRVFHAEAVQGADYAFLGGHRRRLHSVQSDDGGAGQSLTAGQSVISDCH